MKKKAQSTAYFKLKTVTDGDSPSLQDIEKAISKCTAAGA